MSGDAEGVPRDVEPPVAGEELVGQIVRLEEIDQALELLRVLGADVGGLAEQVLRVTDTTHEGVDARVAEAAVDDDRTADGLAGWLQEEMAAVGHVRHVLHGGFVIRVFVQVNKLAQPEVGREPSVIDCCVHICFHCV